MNASRGFSLAELMTALAVAAICLGLGVPGFRSVQQRVRLDATFHTLTASIAMARATAVTRRTPVTVCPSPDGLRCAKTLEWEHGWIVYLDPRKEDSPRSPEQVIRVLTPPRRMLIHASTGRYRIRYQANGLASGTNLSLGVCPVGGQLAGSVIVSNTGRARRELTKKTTSCP